MVSHVQAQLTAARAAQGPTATRQSTQRAPVVSAPAEPPGVPHSEATAPGQFGFVARTDNPGVRFVAAGVGPAQAAELRQTCQRLGLQECSTRHFISRSVSAGE